MESLLLKLGNVTILSKEGEPESAIEKVLELRPNIVFIDVEMPRINGFGVVKAIRERHFSPTFVFVTAYQQYAIKAIKQEAFDYILKPIDLDELSETIERYELNQIRNKDIVDVESLSSLSEREKEVLHLVIKGHTSKEIAEILFISKATVDSHRKKILEKTGSNKLADLIIQLLAN
jgi:RNA polymerase sigma factor (sigma-70 family)